MNTRELVNCFFDDHRAFTDFRVELRAAVVSIDCAMQHDRAVKRFLHQEYQDLIGKQQERLNKFAEWAEQTGQILLQNHYDITKDPNEEHARVEREQRCLRWLLEHEQFMNFKRSRRTAKLWQRRTGATDEETTQHQHLLAQKETTPFSDMVDELTRNHEDVMRRILGEVVLFIWDEAGFRGLDKRASRKHEDLAKMGPKFIKRVRDMVEEQREFEKHQAANAE